MTIEGRDGLTYEQASILRGMIQRVIRRKCVCSILKEMVCFRCREIASIKKAFPENWQWSADLAATMGPES